MASCLESFDHASKDLLRGILLPKRGRLTHRRVNGLKKEKKTEKEKKKKTQDNALIEMLRTTMSQSPPFWQKYTSQYVKM